MTMQPPDHLRALWTLPRGEANFLTRWRVIKSRFSRGVPKGRTRVSYNAREERCIWQRRFWGHHIRDEADYWAHIRYCWMNPVKHGLARNPQDWPYSSVHHDARFRADMDLMT